MRYKSLFIDLDDTLWDTFHNNKECLKELYADLRLERHYASFEAFFSRYMPNNIELWAKYRRGEIDRLTLIIERFRPFLRPLGIVSQKDILKINNHFLAQTTKQTRLIPGAIELLEHLRPHYKMYILSNGFREVQSLKLENSGLAPYFDGIVLSEDAKVQKPHPGIFDYALRVTGSSRESTLMIGDSWDADILGAHDSAIDQIWYNPQQEPARGFRPTYTVVTLAEITHIL